MRVFLVWSQWSGEERGEGTESIAAEMELLPTPRVSEMTAIARRPYAVGILPEGSIRIDQISAGAYTEDMLRGLVIPTRKPTAPSNAPVLSVNGNDIERGSNVKIDFWYELQEDGRGDSPAARSRFRLYGGPSRNPGAMEWAVVLERSSEERSRNGAVTQIGVNEADRFPILPRGV